MMRDATNAPPSGLRVDAETAKQKETVRAQFRIVRWMANVLSGNEFELFNAA